MKRREGRHGVCAQKGILCRFVKSVMGKGATGSMEGCGRAENFVCDQAAMRQLACHLLVAST